MCLYSSLITPHAKNEANFKKKFAVFFEYDRIYVLLAQLPAILVVT